MTVATGTATLDFGAYPGSNEAQTTISGQTAILAGSKVEAWFMADDTSADHTASDHRYAECFINLTCGGVTAATGFTIYARSLEKMSGQWSVRWVWAD